jgi:hypothetical protein
MTRTRIELIALIRPNGASADILAAFDDTEKFIRRAVDILVGRDNPTPPPADRITFVQFELAEAGRALAEYQRRRGETDERARRLQRQSTVVARINARIVQITRPAFTAIQEKVDRLNQHMRSVNSGRVAWTGPQILRALAVTLDETTTILETARTSLVELAREIPSATDEVAEARWSRPRARRAGWPGGEEDERPPRRRRRVPTGAYYGEDDHRDGDDRGDEDSTGQLLGQLAAFLLQQPLQQLQAQPMTQASYPQRPGPAASQMPGSAGPQRNSLADLFAGMGPALTMPAIMLPLAIAMAAQGQEPTRTKRARVDPPPLSPPPPPPPPDGKAPPLPLEAKPVAQEGDHSPQDGEAPPYEGRAPSPRPDAVTVNLGGTSVAASPEVTTALQKAYSGPNPDAEHAYAGTPADPTKAEWQAVDPSRVGPGDVAMWENQSRLVVVAANGLMIVSNGKLLPLADPHDPPDDGHGVYGTFRGFRHPSGLEKPVGTGPVQLAAAP